MLTTFCIFYQPRQSQSIFFCIGRLGTRWKIALVLQAHLSSSQKKQNGEKYVNHVQERKRKEDGDWQRGRDLLGLQADPVSPAGAWSDRGWSVLLIRGVIKCIVQFVLSLCSSTAWSPGKMLAIYVSRNQENSIQTAVYSVRDMAVVMI